MPIKVFAVGSFELNDFPDTLNGIAGQKFKTFINFIYSGTASNVGVSVVGKKVPNGIDLGHVSYGGNGVDSIEYSGIPVEIGNYPLNLVLTDNSGVVLTRHFNFNISGLSFEDNLLPNAIINKPYSQNIKFLYAGTESPLISFLGFPDTVQLSYNKVYAYNSFFALKLIPRQAGTFTFNVNAVANGVEVGTKVFTLVVDSDQENEAKKIKSEISNFVVPEKLDAKKIQETPVVVKKISKTPSVDIKIDKNIKANIIVPTESIKNIKPKWYQRIFDLFK